MKRKNKIDMTKYTLYTRIMNVVDFIATYIAFPILTLWAMFITVLFVYAAITGWSLTHGQRWFGMAAYIIFSVTFTWVSIDSVKDRMDLENTLNRRDEAIRWIQEKWQMRKLRKK